MGMGRIFQKLSSSFTRLELRKINAGAGMEWGVGGLYELYVSASN